MAIRMTGLISNMDTESIIKQLMSAQGIKKTRVENKKTKLEWEQDKWKELNTKIYKFYTDQASKMRLQKNYMTKRATSSNSDKVEITASTSAPQGTQKIQIDTLASAQYVTGKQLSVSGVTTSTKLVGSPLNFADGTLINITSGSKSTVLDVNSNTTVNDFIQTCKNAGLNASYDATQKRFFISSSESGAASKFTMTASSYSNSIADTYKNNIENLVNYSSLSSSEQTVIDSAINAFRGATTTDINYVTGGTYNASTATDAQKQLKSAVDTLNTAVESATKANATKQVSDGIRSAIENETVYNSKSYAGTYTAMKTSAWTTAGVDSSITIATAKIAYDKSITGVTLTEDEKKQAAAYTELNKQVDALVAADLANTDNVNKINTIVNTNLNNYQSTVLANVQNLAGVSITTNSSLTNLGLNNIDGTATPTGGTGMVVVAATDSKIILNGATLTGTTNTMEVNGMTINLKGTTDSATNETISLTVSDDTQAVYDSVKSFITDYNNLLKEMNKLYYASTAKGYEPLTDEQKESMSDDQIEKWETKIKDTLLRRDDKLSSVISSMKTAMTSSVNVDGKNYSLSSYGIMTSIDFTEKGLLHIYGDTTDPTYSSYEDKLKTAIAKDPDTVMKALSGIANKLHSTMTDKMKSSSLNSAFTFYNDKEITKQLKSYGDEINEWESRLKKIEDRYYKQFSAMETAMAKLNSQSSSLAGMLGNQ